MELVLLSLFILLLNVLLLGAGFIIFVVSLLYGKYYFDYSEKNGKRNWYNFRTLFIWRVIKWWFKYKIVYDGDGEETKNTIRRAKTPLIYASHPHGLMALQTVLTFAMINKEIEDKEIYVGVHKLVFYVPFLREWCLWFGGFDISKENVKHMLLTKKKSISIVPGGVHEILTIKNKHDDYDIDGDDSMVYKKHTGFLRIAYENKIGVVPVYNDGENDIFYVWTINNNLRKLCIKSFGYPFPSFFIGPFRVPLTTYIMKPIFPADYKSEKEFIRGYYDKIDKYANKSNKSKKLTNTTTVAVKKDVHECPHCNKIFFK